MLNKIKKVFPFLDRRSRSKFKKSDLVHVLDCQIAYNKYGAYCTPISSMHRIAVQQVLKGDIYEPDTIEYMRSNCSDGDIIHAGTFFGDFLPALSSALPEGSKIWAFEPNPENYRCAEITLKLNQINNVKLINAGLGSETAKAKMQVANSSGQAMGGASKITNDSEGGKFEDIQIEAIDNIIPSNRKISILQLDVEGFEKQALEGALNTIKRCKPLIILEDNDQIIETEWFARNILSIGYHFDGMLHHNTVFRIK